MLIFQPRISLFRNIFLSFIFLSAGGSLWAQQAQVSGTITDPSGAAISQATIELVNSGTQNRLTTVSNNSGLYVIPSLSPGLYRVTAQAKGFESQVLENVRLEVAAKSTFDFTLSVGSESQSVTVDASSVQLNTIDASLSAVVDQKFVENMPLNGRSFQSLLTLVPGVSVIPSSGSGRSGQISVNGMRSESNYFMVDGVSANAGVNIDSPGRGGGYSGSLSNSTALGTTQSLVSIDALQEFRAITSTYSAEYGRVPGGQFSFTTRSGTNQFHGSLYEYFRNDVMDANSFFNNRNRIEKSKMRQNNFGGTFGGPTIIPGVYNGKDKTFFFLSYEALRLRTPQESTIRSVPTLELRNSIAPPELRPVLQLFPLPTPGYAEEAGYTAPFVSAYSQPSTINSTSLKIDHSINDRFKLFGRFAYIPSSSLSRYSGNMAQINDTRVNTKTITIGSTNIFSSNTTNDFRFNVTLPDHLTMSEIDNFGGATPTKISDFDGLSETDWALFSYRVNTFPGFWLNPQNNRQRQINIVNNLTFIKGRHTFKVGGDWRHLRTNTSLPEFYQTPFYYNQTQLLTNTPQLFTGYRSVGDMAPIYKNLSFFLQDEWKVSNRLNLSLGVRWEWSPAPRDANGNQPATVDQLDNVATMKVAPQGSALWKTTYKNFAPRVGLAYRLNNSANYATVLRTGAGLFYDTSSVQASEGYWYGLGITGTVNLNNKPFPMTPQELQNIPAPSFELTPTSNAQVFAFDPNLKMPYALQWNATIEQQLGSKHSLTVSYVGSNARRLLMGRQYYPQNFNNPAFPAGAAFVYGTTNRGTSSYNAMQIQFRRHLSKGLQVLTSYTWSHSIDLATVNFTSAVFERASSNYDIRHNFQTALSYELPGTYDNLFLSGMLAGWALDTRISARSALPLDIIAATNTTAQGMSYSIRPDFDSSKPLYVTVEGAPGQRAINRAAFTVLPNGQSGNAGRNIARGFASYQTDLAFRKTFTFNERFRTTFRAEAFNLFNHANFGSIATNLQSSTTTQPFGWATGTQAAQMGGMNPLYQVGGPRSLQLALRFQF